MEFEYLNDYKGLGRAVFLRGYGKELIATLDVGPRILRFSAEGYQNVFAEDVQEADAQKAGALFEEVCPGAEVAVLSGGQPVYYYIISAE